MTKEQSVQDKRGEQGKNQEKRFENGRGTLRIGRQDIFERKQKGGFGECALVQVFGTGAGEHPHVPSLRFLVPRNI